MIVLLLSLLASAGQLEEAESAYRAGRYAEALGAFQAALAEPGVSEGPVLYDMGNCAFRLGRYSEALLHYRRAQQRMPRDPELAFNLRLAEQRLGLDPPAAQSFGAAVEALLASFTARELLALVGALQALGLVGLVLLWRRPGWRNAMALLVLLTLAGSARLVHDRFFAGPPAAVVLAPEIALRPEPHAEIRRTLTLRAGEQVRLAEASDRWARVVHPRGGGWTERAGIGLVD